MKSILKRIAKDDSIASMTNIELVRYLKAMRTAVVTAEAIENPSDLPLWFVCDAKTICLEPNAIWRNQL